VSGDGRTAQLLSPIRTTVQMPEAENLKVKDLPKSVKQAPHSQQATGHGMHCKEILFTPRCSSRAREFPGSVDFSVRRTVAELRGIKLARFSDFGLRRRYMHSSKCPSSFYFRLFSLLKFLFCLVMVFLQLTNSRSRKKNGNGCRFSYENSSDYNAYQQQSV